MRHGKKFNHLSRSAASRKALLTNLAKVLVLHKRINTTLAKAKALRKFVEPILTKAKQDNTHARRVVFSYFQDKVPVKELFDNIAPKIADRPGGYTRIIRLGNRLGDNAEMCMIELVDYNELFQKRTKPEKEKTRRGRGKKGDMAKETATHATLHEEVAPALTPEASIKGSEEEVAPALTPEASTKGSEEEVAPALTPEASTKESEEEVAPALTPEASTKESKEEGE